MAVTKKTTTRTPDVTAAAIDTSNMSKRACYDYLVDQIALFENRAELAAEGYSLDDLRDLVAEEMEKEVAPPKAAGRASTRAPAAPAPAARASSRAAPAPAAVNVDKMSRGACLDYLVNVAHAYKTKAEIRHAYPAVADLRDLVRDNLVPAGKGGKSSRRTAEPVVEPVQRRTRREVEPVAEPVQRRTRREVEPVAEPVQRRTRRTAEPVAEPVQRRTRRGAANTPALSPIVAFTVDNVDDIVGDVNTSIDALNAAICAATGVDMLGSTSVHATKVHEKCLFLTFAFGTTGASPKALAKLLAEAVEIDKAEVVNDDSDDFQDEEAGESAPTEIDDELVDDLIDVVVETAGVTEEKAREYVEAWFDNYDEKIEPKLGTDVEIGTELYNAEDDLVIVIGYHPKTDKLICFNAETEKLVRYTYDEISHFDYVEDVDGADAPAADAAGDTDPEDEFDEFDDIA
jgi:hypothetical protein